ncbi:hypothetical protein SAMN05443572_101340 [Myxococcus fulvus]|uniref:Uncharacterized protein n=1 Tax=Myxococcus fulvus TaxID=33 RepID=A0A511T0F3_MYXFU|nr:hypothetical protein [Myxococcus fulvus]GEN07646.1 hypothetical protein MFU01_26830 [Myxococcus fulvus]SES84189.1 hypothetical protein SAMN05443572_101340 [Myxococcus fulvus]
MRSQLVLTTVALMGAAFTAGVAQASSDDGQTGLTFYARTFTQPVLNVAQPDGTCTAFPAEADSLVGWSNVQQVLAYRTADCTGQAVGLGTLRTFAAGEFASFIAY